jgi:hypothetical protein
LGPQNDRASNNRRIKMKKFTYAIDENYSQDSNVMIALDPENRELYSHGSYNSTPGNIWHNLNINILRPPCNYVKDSLIKFLESQEVQEILEKIMSSYLGRKWDGSNHVGMWNSDDGSLPDYEYLKHELDVLISNSLADGYIECYWSAEEFCSDENSIKEMIVNCKTLDEAVAELIDNAMHSNIILDNNDVSNWLEENIFNAQSTEL